MAFQRLEVSLTRELDSFPNGDPKRRVIQGMLLITKAQIEAEKRQQHVVSEPPISEAPVISEPARAVNQLLFGSVSDDTLILDVLPAAISQKPDSPYAAKWQEIEASLSLKEMISVTRAFNAIRRQAMQSTRGGTGETSFWGVSIITFGDVRQLSDKELDRIRGIGSKFVPLVRDGFKKIEPQEAPKTS